MTAGHANLQFRPASSVLGHVTVNAQGDDASLSSLTPATYALIAGAGINTVTTSDNTTYDVDATLAGIDDGLTFTTSGANALISLSGDASEIEKLTTPDVAEIGHAVLQRSSVATAVYFSGSPSLDESIDFAAAVGHANLQIRPANSVLGHVTVRAQGDDATLSVLTGASYGLISGAGFNTVTTSDNTTYDVDAVLAGADDGLTFGTSGANALISLSAAASEANALTVSDFQQMGTAIRNPPTGPVAVFTPLQVTGGPVQWSTDQANAAYANAVNAHASLPRSVQVVTTHTDVQNNFSTTEIDNLSKAGVNDIVSDDGSLNVTLAQLTEAAADGVVYSVEGGGDVALAENASDIEQASPNQLAQLASAGVTAVQIGDGSVQLDAAQAEALEDPVDIVVPIGDTVTLADSAAAIEALMPGQIEALQTIGFTNLEATDASLQFTVAQALAVDLANLGVGVPRGDTASVVDTPDNLATLTPSEIAALDALGVTVPCYCRGTHILTERGEVAVEDLRVGDLAVTASGAHRPIVWIGHRALDLRRHPDALAVLPVRVRANAFGEGQPRRDLWLSPGHNIACEGTLMPISSLINGRSVAQIEQDCVEYWHVELDAHDILLAEGLPAESYLDCGNRRGFANGGAFVEAHPDFAPRHWAETCLPLVKQGPSVATAKARLIARLLDAGHCVGPDADAHIVVDGVRVEPISLTPTRIGFVLPPGGREIALRSNVFVPAHTIPESEDIRELGLCVDRLQIDGSPVALAGDEACVSGWHEVEFHSERFSHRWTMGTTSLPPGARVIIVDLSGDGCYWRDSEEKVSALFA